MPKHTTRHKMLTILITLTLALGNSAGAFAAAAGAPATGGSASGSPATAATDGSATSPAGGIAAAPPVTAPSAPVPALSAAQAPGVAPANPATTAPDQKAKRDKGKKAAAKPAGPIVVEADDLRFSDETGDVLARGHVHITQDGTELLAEQVDGNTKRTSLWVNGAATYLDPAQSVNLIGNGIFYNYKEKTGTMETAHGKVDRNIVTGQAIDMQPGEVIIHNGTTTTCPAKVPDYHVSAEKIEIYPGDKMIIYNAKFWIKDKVIFRLPKYQKSLQQGAQSAFPRIGYRAYGGFFVGQYLAYPLSPKVTVYDDMVYYSQKGFRPSYGVSDREQNYNINLIGGHYLDDDGNWIKKTPELNFNYYNHRLGDSPFSYTFNAVYGRWSDDHKTSWHQDYSLYFSRDPIKLSPSLTLYLGTGYELVHESYDDSTNNILRFDTTLNKTVNSRLTAWVGYHYTRNNTTLFDYDRTDLGRELDTGFSYRIDRLNTISFNQSYDLANDRVYDQDYTWTRNLHCWEASITYRAKRDQIVADLSTIRW